LFIYEENMSAAKSRIVDADIAQETAKAVQASILQRAGAAVIAQANTMPALALKLLD
jgi:flagellin